MNGTELQTILAMLQARWARDNDEARKAYWNAEQDRRLARQERVERYYSIARGRAGTHEKNTTTHNNDIGGVFP